MSSQSEIQSLLRFLAQDAKVPLKDAMGNIRALQSAKLTKYASLSKGVPQLLVTHSNHSASPAALASSPLETILNIFPDQKTAKQVHAAAKRSSKKRAAEDLPSTATPAHGSSISNKRPKTTEHSDGSDSALHIPQSPVHDAALSSITLLTNRAPLLLAFALAVLPHTMPGQPLDSRLSLAQAVVSANSRSKAVSIGLRSDGGKSEDHLLAGLRRARILGREIGVLRRAVPGIDADSADGSVPLWGVDTDALHPDKAQAAGATGDMPIHDAGQARGYLGRAFLTAEGGGGKGEDGAGKGRKKKPAKSLGLEKEENLGKLLRALELVFSSWMESDEAEGWHGLGREELDRRAWGWYVGVRPEVKEGRGGWGEKGVVSLGDLLALRRLGKKKNAGDGVSKVESDESLMTESGK